MVEDHDSQRLTDVVDAVGPFGDDDPSGVRVEPGTEVCGYVVDGELGHGGMGVVYSATHPVIGKRAAIKILRPEVSRSPIAVQRFIQEARAVNQIGHPNIIDIFAYGALPDGRAYHVMDLLIGESLRRRLKRSVLHPSEAASVIDEMASALAAAHDNGFVHRDLKPDNVFLVGHEGRWPEVKLLDFGLAKLMPEHGVPAFITKTGMMLGTPEYMSPEQARGIGVDYRTDIYALGIVMFEILAGSRPFPLLGDPLAVLMQHSEEPPLSLGDTVGGLPDEMVQLVDAMLAKTPEARPSLAAVRTVIKRLRTTKLPTRSVAGLAMSSFSQLPARPELGITASRVGAEAVLPGDSWAGDRPRPGSVDPGPPHGAEASPGAPGARSGRSDERSAIPAAVARSHPGPAAGISQPATTTPGVGIDSIRTSNPSLPRYLAPAAPAASPESFPPPPGGSYPAGPYQGGHGLPAARGSEAAPAASPESFPPPPGGSYPAGPYQGGHGLPAARGSEAGVQRSSEGASVDASWQTRPPTGASADASWQTRPPTGASADASWQTRPPTGASVDASWQTRPPTGTEVDASWQTRPPTGTEVVPATSGRSTPSTSPAPRSRRWWLVVAVLLVVAAIVLAMALAGM